MSDDSEVSDSEETNTEYTDSRETNTESQSWASAASLDQESDDEGSESEFVYGQRWDSDSDEEDLTGTEMLVYSSSRFCNSLLVITGPCYRAIKDMESEEWECSHCQKGMNRAASWSIAANVDIDYVLCAVWKTRNFGPIGVCWDEWPEFCEECIQSAKHDKLLDKPIVDHAVYSLSNFDVHQLGEYYHHSAVAEWDRSSLGDIWHCSTSWV